MNIRKFIAPTTRQALKDIRTELGDEAVILSNRTVPEGVEIIAVADHEMSQLASTAVESKMEHKVDVHAIDEPVFSKTITPEIFHDEPAPHFTIPPVARPAPVVSSAAPVQPAPAIDNNILLEIKSMHAQLQQQLAAMSWSTSMQQPQDTQRNTLLRRLMNAGFSTVLARQLLAKLPSDKQAEPWIKQVLKHNLKVVDETEGIVSRGGVYALIGPTGVGKTTTTAKLAARAVVRYGADKVALLTTDSYRIGAYEQLKIYGKILGVAVHAVKDADDLRLTLSALRAKHLVLIDTVGMGQRDERVMDQRAMFSALNIRCLLLLNSTSSGDTLEDVVNMYQKSSEAPTQVIGCILTKLDEAVNPGGVLDVVVRHRLPMHYMANGQRVPEDLHVANPDYLLHQAFKITAEKTPFTLQEIDFSEMMAADDMVHGGTNNNALLAGLNKVAAGR